MPHTRPILVVEDDEDMIFLLERSFQKLGVRNPVKVVHDGEQAIDFLENDESHKPPRLAVVDIRMPLRDGFEVLQRIRSNPRLSRLPVIIFSNSREERDINRAYDSGANSFVVKPSDPRELHHVVQKIHDYWINVNEKPTFPES